MTVGELYLESLATGVITPSELSWLTEEQDQFSRLEEATALRLGRLLDQGDIQLGCRLPLAQVREAEAFSKPLEDGAAPEQARQRQR
jgi:hypothetical protein